MHYFSLMEATVRRKKIKGKMLKDLQQTKIMKKEMDMSRYLSSSNYPFVILQK